MSSPVPAFFRPDLIAIVARLERVTLRAADISSSPATDATKRRGRVPLNVTQALGQHRQAGMLDSASVSMLPGYFIKVRVLRVVVHFIPPTPGLGQW